MSIETRTTPGNLLVMTDTETGQRHYHQPFTRDHSRENQDADAAINKARRQRTFRELRMYARGRTKRFQLSDTSRRVLAMLDWIAVVGMRHAFEHLPWPTWDD